MMRARTRTRTAAAAVLALAAVAAAVACSVPAPEGPAPGEPGPATVAAPADPSQPDSADAPAPRPPATDEVREARALRRNRAYDGAPPMVPHPDKGYALDQCLECHGPGDGAGGDLVAVPTPHPELVHCTSCHVALVDERAEFRPSDAEAFVWPAARRAHAEAPWTIPHPVTMRERCILCHTSPNLAEPARTTHPQRRACTQCHVPASGDWPGARPADAWTGGPPKKDD